MKALRYALIGLLVLALAGGATLAGLASAFAPTREVVYRQVGDVDLGLQIFEPAEAGDGPRPAILFFFGGGWTRGFPHQFYPWAKHFASLGWVGLTADYRVRARNGTGAFEAVDDARAAYRYVHAHADALGIDPARVVLAGGSAGGHLAAASVIAPWEGRDGTADPAALVLLNPALDTRVTGDDHYLAFVADLFEGRGEQISPFHHVRPGLPPTLVVHGTADGLVPFEHSRAFCERMRESGNTCVLDAHEGSRHGFFNWGTNAFEPVLARVVAFATGAGPSAAPPMPHGAEQ